MPPTSFATAVASPWMTWGNIRRAMKGVPVTPRRVFGVAFSDAEDSGRHTWVCRAHPGSGGVRVESVDRLCDLPGGEVDRRAAFRALVAKVLDAPRSAWGLDFAFGLPEAAVERLLGNGPVIDEEGRDPAPAQRRWRALLARVAEAREPASLTVGESPRRTEEGSRVAASRDRSRDLRGLGGVLAPLAAQPHVAVLPHEPLPVLPEGTPSAMRARAPHIYLLEVWPRTLLERLRRQELQSVAGADVTSEAGRDEVVRGLVAASLVRPMAQRTRRAFAADDSGRSLDALLCAVGAWRGYREADHAALCADPRTGLEGHLYP